jgi:hypothetical protein
LLSAVVLADDFLSVEGLFAFAGAGALSVATCLTGLSCFTTSVLGEVFVSFLSAFSCFTGLSCFAASALGEVFVSFLSAFSCFTGLSCFTASALGEVFFSSGLSDLLSALTASALAGFGPDLLLVERGLLVDDFFSALGATFPFTSGLATASTLLLLVATLPFASFPAEGF